MEVLVPSPSQAYRAYSARPFKREERGEVEILFGGLHWRLEKVIQATLENVGYRARPLPTATKDDLLLGRELADIGQCCPTSFVTGNLAGFLKSEAVRIGPEGVADKYVYLTAGACGACRFGQYHQSYELALRNLGFESFRLFLMEQDKLEQQGFAGGGIEIDMSFSLGMVCAVL
jgi:predicted nucleotide-binding protein (sugar kinase/HSP70/actin superfamily)